jgi:hypothetical protein
MAAWFVIDVGFLRPKLDEGPDWFNALFLAGFVGVTYVGFHIAWPLLVRATPSAGPS